MKALTPLILALAITITAGCADNAIADLEATPHYDVELQFSTEHLTTLEHVEVEAFVTDEDGALVTSLPEVNVEYRAEGSVDWSTINLAVHGDHYAAEHVFTASGEFEFRVVGAVDDHSDHLEVMYTAAGHTEIERAHMEMNGLSISFENFPGDVHEGDEAELRFWVTEATADGHLPHGASATMMPGLVASVTCLEADGETESHEADEHEAGVYEAHHAFSAAGEATITVQFMHGGMMNEASFEMHVNSAD